MCPPGAAPSLLGEPQSELLQGLPRLSLLRDPKSASQLQLPNATGCFQLLLRGREATRERLAITMGKRVLKARQLKK